MVEGRLPFGGNEVWEVQANIQQAPDPVLRYAGPLGPVIQGLLTTDPDRRLDAAGAEEMLRDVLADPGGPTPARAATPAHPPTARPTPPASGPVPAVTAAVPAASSSGPVPSAAVPSEPSPVASGGGRGRLSGWKVAAAAACVVLLAGGGWLVSQGDSGGKQDDASGQQGGEPPGATRSRRGSSGRAPGRG